MTDSIMMMVNKDGVAEVYDDTYDITIHCTSEEEQKRCKKILNGDRWIPVEERPPESENYVLLSFENFSIPMVGRYEADEEGGGKFYIGDEEESCMSQNLIVNAWMPLPKPYMLAN